jgi:hypothetical protein
MQRPLCHLCARPARRSFSSAPPPPPAVRLLSTEEIHACNTTPQSGPYAAARLALDYGWHGRYTLYRQQLQDRIIAAHLVRAPPPPCGARPWLVHTCGAMGAGKSHVMRWLAATGAFPLHAFVTVDPDRIKGELPELAPFVAADRASAGTRLHKESLLIADVLTQSALAEGRNVLVDGSMRNTQWYGQEWTRLRVAAPRHRLAVLLVEASPRTILGRAAVRAVETGREVPPDVLNDSIVRAPATFERLRPLADFSAVIDNDGAFPKLRSPSALRAFAETFSDCAWWPSVPSERGEDELLERE